MNDFFHHWCFAGYEIHLPHDAPELAKTFKVASIKHMGHHVFELPKGKDTTLHFASGAVCSAGIDKEKSVFESFVVKGESFLDVFVESLCCPSSKAGGNRRLYSVSYCDYYVEVVVGCVSFYLSVSFCLN